MGASLVKICLMQYQVEISQPSDSHFVLLLLVIVYKKVYVHNMYETEELLDKNHKAIESRPLNHSSEHCT